MLAQGAERIRRRPPCRARSRDWDSADGRSPAGFPQPPKPPPASQADFGQGWLDYLDRALYEWQKKLVAALS
jgi:hypothetical protein